MSHITHLHRNRFSIRIGLTHLHRNHSPVPNVGICRAKFKRPMQGFARALAQKRGDLRIQDEGCEHTLNAGDSHGNISSVTNFASPAITKFEPRMGLIGGHRGETTTGQKFVTAA